MKTTMLMALTALLALIQAAHVHSIQVCTYPSINCPDSSGTGTCCGTLSPGQCCSFGTGRRSVKWFFSSCGSCVGTSWPNSQCSGGNLGGVGGGGDFCKSFSGTLPNSATFRNSAGGQMSSLEWAYVNGTAVKPPTPAEDCVEADSAFYEKDGVRTWFAIPQGQLHHVVSLLDKKDYTALEMLAEM